MGNKGREDWCGNCAWLWKEVAIDQVTGAEVIGTVKECRRYPPTGDSFAKVFSSDWCGEHVPESRD